MAKENRIPEVDAYIRKAPDFARPILTRLRELFHRAEPRIRETMKWGVPHFEYKGIVGSFAAFKQHVGFGFWKSKLMKDPAGLFNGDPKASMSSSKVTSIKQLPADKIMLAYITQAVELNENEIKVPQEKKRRPKLTAPSYFLVALRKNKKANETYNSFSDSHRREYIEWLLEAKHEQTRQKRLDTTIEWLSEGKPRNWKYMKPKAKTATATSARSSRSRKLPK
jgi:hypothetical protein